MNQMSATEVVSPSMKEKIKVGELGSKSLSGKSERGAVRREYKRFWIPHDDISLHSTCSRPISRWARAVNGTGDNSLTTSTGSRASGHGQS